MRLNQRATRGRPEGEKARARGERGAEEDGIMERDVPAPRDVCFEEEEEEEEEAFLESTPR